MTDPQEPNEPQMGPPEGQDSASPPPPPIPVVTPVPSDFLTPTVPFETIEPEPSQGVAGSPIPSTAPGSMPAPSRLRRGAAIGLAILLAIGGVTAAILASGGKALVAPSGPPDAPTDVTAKARACAPPKCDTVHGEVEVAWSASGGDPTKYTISRDGFQVGTTEGDQTGFIDEDAGLGEKVSYTVTATNAEGTSSESAAGTVKIPVPPLTAAQLSGTYRVVETVTRATFLGRFEGIDSPTPGDTTTSTWTFSPTCHSNEGACPTKIFGDNPPLKPKGRVYTGSPNQEKARCNSGSAVPTDNDYRLVITKAKVTSTWTVSAFTGTYSVSFTCSGGFTSSGTVKVTGTYKGS